MNRTYINEVQKEIGNTVKVQGFIENLRNSKAMAFIVLKDITGKLSEDKIVELIRENFDLRPAGIIKMLDLRRPIYKQTAAYGHFGRPDLDLPWEKTDKAELLKKYL